MPGLGRGAGLTTRDSRRAGVLTGLGPLLGPSRPATPTACTLQRCAGSRAGRLGSDPEVSLAFRVTMLPQLEVGPTSACLGWDMRQTAFSDRKCSQQCLAHAEHSVSGDSVTEAPRPEGHLSLFGGREVRAQQRQERGVGGEVKSWD